MNDVEEATREGARKCECVCMLKVRITFVDATREHPIREHKIKNAREAHIGGGAPCKGRIKQMARLSYRNTSKCKYRKSKNNDVIGLRKNKTVTGYIASTDHEECRSRRRDAIGRERGSGERSSPKSIKTRRARTREPLAELPNVRKHVSRKP